jgi:Mat/Ecp fimbriae outer membrane usher protein
MFLRLAIGLLLACGCAMPSWAQISPIETPIQAATVATDAPDPPVEPDSLPVFIVEEGAPPGFENLDIPQQTVIDVSYGGQKLSPASAVYTPTSVRFTNPKAVVREIPGVLYPDRIVKALSGPLEPNADRVCRKPGHPAGCGLLAPDVAGVIYDANRFQVEIFVGRSMLQLARINDDERIPPPRSDWSGLATLGGSIGGSSASEANYSFRADTLLAHGPTHLSFVSDVQTGGNYVVDRLALNHDWDDWQVTSGLYRSTPYRVLGENEVVGVRLRSSLRTRTRLYLDRAYGSTLQVFLLRRSLVQVFREGRLLVSGVYDVGNQELDTSEMPDGAYAVEIRVRDPVSGESREQQFFAKTNDLPPLGQIYFNAEAGFLRERADRDNPLQVTEAGVLRFSSALRLGTRFGLDADFAFIDEETVFTAGGLWLGQNLVMRAGPVVTSRGSAGVEFFGSFEKGPFYSNINLRGFWGETSSRFLRIPSTDFLYSASYTWKRLRVGLHGNVRESVYDDDPRYSITPSINFALFRRSRFRGDLRVEYTHADQGDIFMVKIDLVEWINDFQLSQSALGRYEDTDEGPRGVAEGDLRAQWRSPRSVPADVQAAFRVSRREDRVAIAASGDVRSHRGAASAFVEQSFHDDFGPETFYGSQFSVGVVGDREGIDALGENAGSSAVLIEISGDYEDGLFDLIVNESRRATTRVGQPLLLPLPPYGQYDVRISSTRGQSIDYDSTPRRITLHPGSTARLRWEVRRIFVLIGAVVRADGSIVANARVDGAVGEAATDENGFLQADVAEGARLLLKTRDSESVCEIIVPDNPEVEDFVILDEIVCSEDFASREAAEPDANAATMVSIP